jgi:hypothetical protein
MVRKTGLYQKKVILGQEDECFATAHQEDEPKTEIIFDNFRRKTYLCRANCARLVYNATERVREVIL